MKSKSVLGLCVIMATFCFAVSTLSAQTKSLETVIEEIGKSSNPELFSATYERDLTTVKLAFDLREDNKNLKKPFKEFELELSSIYSGPAVEEKSIRSLMCIKTRSKRFHFSSSRDLTFYIDNETLRFSEGERSTELRKRKAKEKLCWEMDKESLRAISKSKKVSFLVGSYKASIQSAKSDLISYYAQILATNNAKKQN